MLALFLLSLLLVRHAYSASACYGNSTNATAPVYIAPFDLPTIYAASTSGQDAAAANEIRNTLALYPIAIDGKNFDILSEVFADDIIANYTITLGVLTSVPAIAKGIQAAVQFVTTQHQLGTQAIDVREGSCEAKSVSYFTATHFGQGRYENQVCQTLIPCRRNETAPTVTL